MTIAPDAQALAFDDFTGAVRALQERGLRISTPRRLVLRALFAADGPVSAEQIAAGLQLELTSVYRNLETFERHGLVRHVHLGHGAGLYTLVGHGEREYLYCQRCGDVREVEPERIDPVRGRIRELFGYEARFTHFALVGTCARCSRDHPRPGDGHR
jgi:Fur family ferric uptake transcriptional regulator